MKLPLKLDTEGRWPNVKVEPIGEGEGVFVTDADGEAMAGYGGCGSHGMSCTPEFVALIEGRPPEPIASYRSMVQQSERVRAFLRAVVALEHAWGLVIHATNDPAFTIRTRDRDPLIEEILDEQKLDARDATT